MTNAWETSVWPDEDDEDAIRRRQIEEMMRTDRPRYFRDESVQQEYRDILGRQEAQQQGREWIPSVPGAKVSAPVDRSAAGQQGRDRVTALTGGQSELQAGSAPAVDQDPSHDPADLLNLGAANGKRIDDPRVLSDVTTDSNWTPLAQYAARKRPPELDNIRGEGRDHYYEPQGHHEMPKGIFTKWKLQPEVYKIFDGSTTGKNKAWLREIVAGPDGPQFGPRKGNIWDPLHQAYNDAVEEIALDFFPKNGIRADGSNMTSDQALEILKQIRQSDDPRVRDFNYNIRRIQRLYRLRSGSDD